MMSNVQVAVRVRPMNKREMDIGAGCVVDMDNNQTILSTPKGSIKKAPMTFAFDHCFWSMDPDNPKYASQDMVFNALGTGVLDNAFEGYNACVIAYGQTGSGKSYTMMGSLSDEKTRGIIPRLCDILFEKIAERCKATPTLSFKVEVSYLEVYCEKVKDLLSPKGTRHNLRVREHMTLGPYVEGLSKLAVTSFQNINELLLEGNKSRTVTATQMNAESSRSHAVFSLVLTQTDFDPTSNVKVEKVSKISLIDLAGSEIVSRTGAMGTQLKEASLINKSLTTLGMVISLLADISAGKKPKDLYIPYRNSTLTWLLKNDLGGKSKTVMVATLSPASDNFEETLSTLRYAGRTKTIVNHPVVNKDPNSVVICELREEVKELQSMISQGKDRAALPNQIKYLKEKLRISEGLIEDMTKSWEQKLQDTKEIHEERQKALEEMGISLPVEGIGVQKDKSYLVNLNADPCMSELLVCYLKKKTRVGRPSVEGSSTPQQDIQLRGLGIAQEHCVFEIEDRDIFLTPFNTARTLVNGHRVTERVHIKHGDRILFGNSHLFRLYCPWQQDNHEHELMDYKEAMNEISAKHDPMYKKMQEDLIARHAAEKEGSLEAQRVKYEEQLKKLREQLEKGPTRGSPTSPTHRSTTLEKEWEECNRERMITTVILANRLVQEANMLAEALHEDTQFHVVLTVPLSILSRGQTIKAEDISTSNEVAIRVLHKQRGTDSVWSVDTLEEKIIIMRDMYERMEEGGSSLDETLGPDPFYDLERHALLGVANFHLDCLHYDIAYEYSAPIVAPTGKVCGHLKVVMHREPTHVPDCDSNEMDICKDNGDDLLPRVTYSCQISVVEASGLPKEYCHHVFCQYQFWNKDDPVIIPPLVQSGQEKATDRLQKFEHSQVFTIEVTDEFLAFIDNGILAVEVWVDRNLNDPSRGGVIIEGKGLEVEQQKSFPEKWSEVTQHLELRVEMMEFKDKGEYIPVEMQCKPDVTTGGVFMIQPSQLKRINVAVRTVPGSSNSPLKCDSITHVSLGSIYLRNRCDDALDSFQTHDLKRLRNRWSDELMKRREYLDTEVRKIMDKREPNVADLERQKELLDQWAMLQWQRASVLQPKADSGVPGAPTNWKMIPEFESRVPVLFLDLSDDLFAPSDDDPVGAVSTGPLFGEKEESMINLPIIKQDNHPSQLRATASWDSTIHDSYSLNKITGNNDRVYAILKVGIALSHPPGVELVLRKRICLRVYQNNCFQELGELIRICIGKEECTSCGVMYQVVTGIPTVKGMQPRPSVLAYPSLLELKKDENAVEKFKMAMTSITNILTLDQLKQEVALKEKLTTSGKTLKTRVTLEKFMTSPQSLSRADSDYFGSRAESPEPVAPIKDPEKDQPIMMVAIPTKKKMEVALKEKLTISKKTLEVGSPLVETMPKPLSSEDVDYNGSRVETPKPVAGLIKDPEKDQSIMMVAIPTMKEEEPLANQSKEMEKNCLSVDEDLKRVKHFLWDLRTDWRILGEELKLKQNRLKEIENENKDVKSRFNAMLNCWLSQISPAPTWDTLIDALRSPFFDRKDVADRIRDSQSGRQERTSCNHNYLCIEDLPKVRNHIVETMNDWYNLGSELGIESYKLEAIKNDHRDVKMCFSALVVHWLERSSPPPTWQALLEALRSDPVGREDVANQIETDLKEGCL